MEREVANGDRGEEHRNHVGKVVAMGTPSMRFSESAEDPFALGRGASAVLDDQGTVVGWSARAQELLGYPAKEVIGRAWQDLLVDALDLPAARSVVVDAIRTGGWFGVLPVRHRDGRRVEMGFRARAVTRDGDSREWVLVGAPAAEVDAWQRDRALLDGLYRRSPIGLVTYGPDRRVIRVNRAIERRAVSRPRHRWAIAPANSWSTRTQVRPMSGCGTSWRPASR